MWGGGPMMFFVSPVLIFINSCLDHRHGPRGRFGADRCGAWTSRKSSRSHRELWEAGSGHRLGSALEDACWVDISSQGCPEAGSTCPFSSFMNLKSFSSNAWSLRKSQNLKRCPTIGGCKAGRHLEPREGPPGARASLPRRPAPCPTVLAETSAAPLSLPYK